ncbi:MAG: dehydrogenase [Bacteroidetes bacterium]|nr:MAG: dehydrogenase [Bacteroidota bacterium]
MKTYRSKAPLRLGLAGGGTDVPPYSDLYGGAVLNATINKYAYATISPRNDGKIVFNSLDNGQKLVYDATNALEIDGELDLLKGIYNRIVSDFTQEPLSFELSTIVDAPPGSGLGTSSTLVVTILGAFVEWLKLPLGEYDIARLAYEIERIDLTMAGGKQDQYAATFGGVNYMEFFNGEKVVVNPLRIRSDYLDELAYNLVLFNTETSRLSSKIIARQAKNIEEKDATSLDATHKLKIQALMMKEALLKGELDKIGEILDYGWHNKKLLAPGITNPMIDELYKTAIDNGASGGKISGAGGGGFILFYCPNNSRHKVIKALSDFGGVAHPYEFTVTGLKSWSI